eukprot:797808-Rhodomonas_salina.1
MQAHHAREKGQYLLLQLQSGNLAGDVCCTVDEILDNAALQAQRAAGPLEGVLLVANLSLQLLALQVTPGIATRVSRETRVQRALVRNIPAQTHKPPYTQNMSIARQIM